MFSLTPQATPPSPATADDSVKDVGLSTFVADVIEASKTALVVVDFWATWCGPCKQLTPVLEKLARASKGAVRLAKIDIDKNQPIAQQMGVQSVPSVFAFYQGRPVDAFAGALPEAQVKAWVDQLLQQTGAAPADDEAAGIALALEQAEECLAAKDADTARAIFMDVLERSPDNATAYAGVVRCALAAGDLPHARQMIDAAPAEIAKEKGLISVRAALDIEEQASQAGADTAGLEARLKTDANDHHARFDLALAHYAAGRREDAVDALLEIVRRARSWNDDAARKQLVKFFEAFGAMDPLTVATRKRLSSLLFS